MCIRDRNYWKLASDSDVPIDATYVKRKRQVYLSERVLDKTRSYFEVNAGVSMILNTLMTKVESSCRSLPASCHQALEDMDLWLNQDVKAFEKDLAHWKRDVSFPRRHQQWCGLMMRSSIQREWD
eukprot:2866618-Amphidinium_carterae.1